jgi:hypothetical protein
MSINLEMEKAAKERQSGGKGGDGRAETDPNSAPRRTALPARLARRSEFRRAVPILQG